MTVMVHNNWHAFKMKIFPYDILEYRTDLSKKEVIDCLDYNIEKSIKVVFVSINFFPKNKLKKYRGYANQADFRLQRIPTWGYNGFIPIALGKVMANKDGCLVRVKVRPFIFLYFLLIMLALFSSIAIVAEVQNSMPTKTQIEFYENEHLRESIRETLTEDEFANMFKEIESPGLSWKEIFDSLLFFLITYLFVLLVFNYELKIIKEDLKKMTK